MGATPEKRVPQTYRSGPKPRRRFSTVLMATIISLITLSVFVSLFVLNGYFSRRVDVEFQKKVRAQKGQVELLIDNRMTAIDTVLREMSSDNTIRVTVMLGAQGQLSEHITQSYPDNNGTYFFVQNYSDRAICPEENKVFSDEVIRSALKIRPRGEIFQDRKTTRLLWLFSMPILHTEGRMGTAYALYDILNDRELIAAVREAVEGEIAYIKSDTPYSLITGKPLSFNPRVLRPIEEGTDISTIGSEYAYTRISEFEHVYFLSSLKPLNVEKGRVTLLMGLFSGLVLAAAVLIAFLIGRRMTRPLRDMTRKAIQISEGQKDLLFDQTGPYWEFDQMSEAFNYMLSHLKDAEERSRYRELFENVGDAVYIVDNSGKLLVANTAAYSPLGYTPAVFYELGLDKLLPEQDAQRLLAQVQPVDDASPVDKLTLETVHRKSDGSVVPVEIHSRPILYRANPVILNVARDISRRVEAEKALRESEERYRSVVENSSDGIMVLGERLQILFANRVLSKILDQPIHTLECSRFKDYLLEGGPPFTIEYLTRSSDPLNLKPPAVYQVTGKDGERRTVKITANRFEDSNGQEKLVAQVVDISDQLQIEEEKNKLEAQLIHAQKMEAIGTLAGGIAHDFNNLLMGIQGRLSMIRMQSNPKQPHFEHIEPIEKTILSATNLTNQLLGFARKGQYEIKPICINTLVEESTRMFISTRKEIELQLNCREDVLPVKADRGQIEQVLINLYVNAWQAMPQGGQLTIKTENIHLSDAFCKRIGIQTGEYVKISVSDSGDGMDRDTMERIFEPFFTTKGLGKGTGLGLASAYGIIKTHKGAIQVDSRRGLGTIFRIYLPVADTDVAEKPAVRKEKIARGKGKILVVDDEEGSIIATELMMRELGYEVESARSGEEALRLYRENRQEFDLITLDMIMPGMNGKETFDRLKQINPNIRVLLISGYSHSRQADEIIRQGGIGLLQKPYDIFSLSSKLSQVMKKH